MNRYHKSDVNAGNICSKNEVHTMNYKIYNNNSQEWVLLIHGLGGSINTWKYQIEDLNEYNVLAVDLEGHGGSAFEKRRRLLTRSASEINEILESEHIEKVHVIALSLGTLVAMEFAYLARQALVPRYYKRLSAREGL